jgi:hypothetical protein
MPHISSSRFAENCDWPRATATYWTQPADIRSRQPLMRQYEQIAVHAGVFECARAKRDDLAVDQLIGALDTLPACHELARVDLSFACLHDGLLIFNNSAAHEIAEQRYGKRNPPEAGAVDHPLADQCLA